MNEQLKTCPFCGGEAELKTNESIGQVVCTQCGARNLWSSNAQALWNKRTKRDTSLKPCPICGKKGRVFQAYDGSFCVQCLNCSLTTNYFQNANEAKNAWNTRANEKNS